MNLILCRNVMIYFDPAAIRRLAGQLFEALAPGGWLIIGPSDPPLWDFAPFEVVSTGAGLFYRRPARALAAASRMPGASIAAAARRPERARAATPPLASMQPPMPVPRARPLALGRAAARTKPQNPARTSEQAAESEAARAAQQVRAAADAGTPDFSALAQAAAKAHPLNVEIQYLHAMALLSARRFQAACAIARRVVYLDGSLVMGHFILATALARTGQKEAARRSYRKVEALCAALPPEEKVRFADGETAAMLREAARHHLQAERMM